MGLGSDTDIAPPTRMLDDFCVEVFFWGGRS